MRRLITLLTLLALLVVAPDTASARDMTGKGGLGLQQSSHPQMSRLPTLLFRYWGRWTCWEMLVGLDLVRDRSQTAVYFKSAPTTQVFMLDSAVPDQTGANSTVDHTEPWFFDSTHIFVGFGAHRMVYEGSNLSVTVGARGVAQFSTVENKARSSTGEAPSTNALALLAEIPLQAEFFLSDHSSVTASVALTASISSSLVATNDKEGGLADLISASGTNRSGMTMELGGQYSGGVGYTYYF